VGDDLPGDIALVGFRHERRSDYLVRLYDGTELRLSRTFWRSFKERLGTR
jgi:DNA-binding LytR/AlgR family response regulator